MQANQQSTAKEQGNHCEQNTETDIAWPVRIVRKIQIGQAADVTQTQQRPKQEHGSDQDGAMKKGGEIVFRQKRKEPATCKRLS